jgi:hypothetical protein
MSTDLIIYKLRKRAEIRRQIPGRRSVQENAPDRIADLLEEAATALEKLKEEKAHAFEECAEAIRVDVSLDKTPKYIFKVSKHTYDMFMERARRERKGL